MLLRAPVTGVAGGGDAIRAGIEYRQGMLGLAQRAGEGLADDHRIAIHEVQAA